MFGTWQVSSKIMLAISPDPAWLSRDPSPVDDARNRESASEKEAKNEMPASKANETTAWPTEQMI